MQPSEHVTHLRLKRVAESLYFSSDANSVSHLDALSLVNLMQAAVGGA